MKTALFSIFLLFSVQVFAQDYTVIQVTGQIKLKKSGQILARGNKISSADQLVFLTRDAVAACFASDQGRVTLRLDPQQPKTGDEFLAYVKGSIVPAKGALMTRAGGAIKNQIEWDNYFAGGPFLILGTTKVNVSEKAWPMNDSTFFFIRFEYEGEQVNKKLPGDGEKLIISAEQILLVDEKPVDASKISLYEIYYYDAAAQKSLLMSKFQPVFANGKDLIEEVNSLLELLRGYELPEEKLRGEVEAYLSEYYGKTDPEALTEWLAVNVGMK